MQLYLNTTICIGSIVDINTANDTSLRFKYNNLYRFNKRLYQDAEHHHRFKYNNLYRFNYPVIKLPANPTTFKYNNLYRFNLFLEVALQNFQTDLNTTICIGSILWTWKGFHSTTHHLNTTICIGSMLSLLQKEERLN